MRRRPKLTDRTTLTREQARYYTAALHRLAEHRYSVTLLAERLEISYHQVRHLCRRAGIDMSKPLITRPGKGGRPRKPKPEPKPKRAPKRQRHGECPACGRTNLPLDDGLIPAHLQELVGSRGLPKHGNWCDGQGQKPADIDHEGALGVWTEQDVNA